MFLISTNFVSAIAVTNVLSNF